MNLLGKALTLISSAVLLTLGFMFSLVLVAAVAVVGLALGAWFFWNTRHLRKAMRDAQDIRQPAPTGEVIEGEAVVVEEYRDRGQPILPEASRKPLP